MARTGSEFTISRTFDAPRELMFKLWTEREHLLHWFGPKGVTLVHCTNDLRVGGVMHYCMRGPDGADTWGKWVYREIVPPERLVFLLSFSDAAGNAIREPSMPEWPLQLLSIVTFEERDGRTTVTVHWSPYEATDAERATFDAGHDSMRGGWTGTFEQLADYLARVSR